MTNFKKSNTKYFSDSKNLFIYLFIYKLKIYVLKTRRSNEANFTNLEIKKIHFLKLINPNTYLSKLIN